MKPWQTKEEIDERPRNHLKYTSEVERNYKQGQEGYKDTEVSGSSKKQANALKMT